MIRSQANQLHPRLTVVPVADRARRPIHPAPGRTVVGHAQLATAMEAVADRRRAALRERIAILDAELAGAESQRGVADAAVEQRRADRDGFLAAATWAEAVPAAVAEVRHAVAAAEAQLADRLRASREAARALDRVLDQRAQADAAIAEARRQLELLGATSGDSPERQQAASQLAAQAESVEARLADAIAEARSRSEQTKRAVTETERELEQLTRGHRDDLARLAGLVDCLPGESRPPHAKDPVAHVAAIATGLRALADVVDAELAGLVAEADRRRADCEARRRHVEAVRGSLDRVAPEDAAEALSTLVTHVAEGVVVLDDIVATAGDGLLRALESSEPSAPLVLLSSDPAVLGWAIDLPADRGAIAGPAVVDLLTDTTTHDRSLNDRQAVTTSTGDHP